MGASNPSQPGRGQPQQPVSQAQTLPQATPLGPNPSTPQVRPVTPAQPVAPTQPMPQAQPVPQGPAGRATPQQPVRPGQPTRARPVAVQTDRSKVAVYQRKGEEPEEEISSVAIKHSPPWLISAAFHMTVLIILGLLVVAMQQPDQVFLEVSSDEEDIWAEKLGEQVEMDTPLGIDDAELIQDPQLAFTDLPEVDDPYATPPNLEIVEDGNMSTSDLESRIPGYALKGREEGAKRALGKRYGGTRLTREAVKLGLDWLVRNQRPDGSWSLCGPYKDGVPDDDFDNPVAATAMALLAFQGDGSTHKKGDYRKNVSRGWAWLIKRQGPDGNFFSDNGPYRHQFYTQGQCAIAICELYGMSQDEKYREPAERAVQYLVKTQGSAGGWKYSPNARSDLSVTGWIVMALQSAKMAGLEVPEETFQKVEQFLDKVSVDGGARYKYEAGKPASRAMTAEGLLCRQYLGWARDDPRLVAGVEYITQQKNLVSFTSGRDVYYWYYATQVAHHMEGESWDRWNGVMRQALPEQQVRDSRERGSWDPLKPTADQWEVHGGRLYVTCLSIYMLEVYYRHLPIYTNVYSDLLKAGRTERFKD